MSRCWFSDEDEQETNGGLIKKMALFYILLMGQARKEIENIHYSHFIIFSN